MPEIPYGVADYTRIRAKNMAYVDKTRFIAELEKAGRFLFFLRPRRSGKSLMVSTLAAYYDRNFADRFENLFGDSWIGSNPTPEKNQYMVLAFNFSEVRPETERVEASFEQYTTTMFNSFLRRYEDAFDETFRYAVEKMKTAGDRLSTLFEYCRLNQHRLYIIIDEYDNFTNTILSTYGKGSYHDITHGAGFFRFFFNVLKGAAGMTDSGLERLFITGVSPVTMDDVTSGFNIGTQVSLYPALQAVAGFTEDEVADLLNTYRIAEVLNMTLPDVLDLTRDWFGGYRFTKKARQDVFNPAMVLYFVQTVLAFQDMPDQLIDQNVRIDYGKLRHLLLAGKKLNGNFDTLKSIMENREISSPIAMGFPVEELKDAENFISLVYYLGLITHTGRFRAEPLLCIPNKTIESLLWGQLRDAYKDNGVFKVDPMALQQALEQMGWFGNWKPFFRLLADAVQEYTTVRDYIQGEKVIQGFLLAYLNTTHYFLTGSEQPLNKGFCDIFLEPFRAGYPDIRYGYLIELKYIKRGVELTDALLQAEVDTAKEQLTQYRKDSRLAKVGDDLEWICPVLVFHGWEMVYCDD